MREEKGITKEVIDKQNITLKAKANKIKGGLAAKSGQKCTIVIKKVYFMFSM